MRYLKRASPLALALLLSGCSPPAPCRLVARDVHYGPGPRQVLDVYRPPDRSPRAPLPAIVAIHGGAWSGGDKLWGESVADVWCPRGYAVVAVEYRVAPEHRWPAQLDDVRAALAHVRSDSVALGIDPARIGALGRSAGGHLAAMLALRGEPRVRAAVVAAGEADLTVLGREPIMAREREILEAVLGDLTPERLRDLSPVAFARADASVLVVHDPLDDDVFYPQGLKLRDALLAAGADVDFLPVSGGHARGWRSPEATRRAAHFLGARLGGRYHPRRTRIEPLVPRDLRSPLGLGEDE